MKRRTFMQVLASAAASVMVPLQLTVFGNELDDLKEALRAPPDPVISWQSWEEIGVGYINIEAARNLDLYRSKYNHWAPKQVRSEGQ